MNCPHHIQWVVPVAYGQHQCMQCFDLVTRKDVTPKYEDLAPGLQKKWEAHEATYQPPAAPPPAAPPPATPPLAMPSTKPPASP